MSVTKAIRERRATPEALLRKVEDEAESSTKTDAIVMGRSESGIPETTLAQGSYWIRYVAETGVVIEVRAPELWPAKKLFCDVARNVEGTLGRVSPRMLEEAED